MIITSNILKIIKHPEICIGDIHPISAQLDLSNRCNLNCSFCVSKDSRLSSIDINYDILINILHKLKLLRCKGIELTGGGEPTLHNKFNAIVKDIKEFGFDIGLITNGTKLVSFDKNLLSEFDWIRVSLNSSASSYKEVHGVDLFYKVFDGLKVLDTSDVFYGVSYIHSNQSLLDIIELHHTLCELKNISYIRLAKDVNDASGDIHDFFRYFVLNSDLKVDMQLSREMWVPSKCIMYKIKPRVDINGDVFPCCISQYRNVNKIGYINNFYDMMLNNADFDVDVSKCPYCIYGSINDFVLSIINSDVKNQNFI